MEDSDHSSGLISSARRLGETFLGILRNRLELFALELQEEKQRLVEILVYVAASIFFTILALVVLTLTIVVLVPEAGRPLALLGFSGLYVVLAVAAFVGLRKSLKGRAPFSASSAELKKDAATLRVRK